MRTHPSTPRSCHTSRHALTLVEVLAVVVILGMLAATLLTATLTTAMGRGRQELARTAIGTIAARLEMYHMDHGSFPTGDNALHALSDPSIAPDAPYRLSADTLIDPWGRPYELVVPGPHGRPFEILCLGSDGQLGGSGESSDISSAHLSRAPEAGR